jgi:hypothetical protein
MKPSRSVRSRSVKNPEPDADTHFPAGGGHGNEGRESQPVSTFLVIPYFSGDRGRPSIERPLSSSIVWWLCPSIIVNGQPGKNAFQRGVPTSVTVDVANWGAGTLAAPVQVQVWWADPSTGFTTKSMLGQSVVIVPTGGSVRRSPPIVGIIPASAPAHVCLLAYASSPLDVATPGSPVNPVNDRRWAQLNIAEITTTVGQQFQFMVWAGNPLGRAATFDVAVQLLSREALPMLTRVRRAETVRTDRTSLQIFERQRGDEDATRRSERGARRQVTIEPGQRRAMHVIGELPADIEPGTSVAFEIVQSGRGEDDQPRVYGALGLIVTARPRG